MTPSAMELAPGHSAEDGDLSALATGKGGWARAPDTGPIVVLRQVTGRWLHGAKGRSETAIRHNLSRSPGPLAGGGMALWAQQGASAGYVRQCSGRKAAR